MKQYYILDASHRQTGPYSESDIRTQYANGYIAPTDYVWCEGMSEWRPISEVFYMPSNQPAPVKTINYANPFAVIINLFKNYVNFSGRARRKEYWMTGLWNNIIIWGYAIISIAITLFLLPILGEEGAIAVGGLLDLLRILYILSIVLPSLALWVRRLHDTGRSGWCILLILIPFIGPIVLLVFACLDSEHGTNKYGPCEKYPNG